jgi:phosphoribosylformimino-5-aminoimidazole carboxamide ribotide isomerase
VKLVAVLDLMQGRVVHARRGERDAYRPLASTLTASTKPVAVAEALLAMFPFDALYVADLDCILRRGDNFATMHALRRRFPRQEIWLDAGFSMFAALESFLAARLGIAVLGSESQADLSLLELAQGRDVVLSLDFRAGGFLGPPSLLERSDLWPKRVIALDLARVGSTLGPDADLVGEIHRRRPEAEVYAGGGVRSAQDLLALERAGAAGVLLASALHEGRLARQDLETIRRG